MKTYIILENIEIYAYHGVFEQENRVGNNFSVDVKLDVDVSRACESDNLDDTLSYAEVYDIIKREMDISSRLLEHAGGRIIRALKDNFPAVEKIELKISKKNPPTGGQVGSASLLLID